MIYWMLLVLLACPLPSWATTYFVATTGNDTTGNGSSGSPWLTIQKCNDAAAAGDTCSVNDGTYTTASTSSLVAVTKANITFKSTNPLGAKLSGSSNLTAIAFNYTAGSVNGVTIQDFEIYGFNSTAISINTAPAPNGVTIRGNYIHDIGNICSNSAFGFAGIFTMNGTANTLIERNRLYNIGRLQSEDGCTTTQTQNDHGIYIDGGTGTTIQNNIFDKITRGFSLNIYPNPSTSLAILNNTFVGSSTHVQGHILFGTTITSADISNNISYQPTLAFINVNVATFSSTTVRNNLTTSANLFEKFNGVVGTPSGITLSGPNLLSTDPLFTNVSGHDYTLTAPSPAIDRGVVNGATPDFAGISRPQGSAYDIGAYEFFTSVVPSAPTGLKVE